MPNYTTPATAVAGNNLTAAQWNAGVRDSMENLARPPRARVARTANQALGNGVVSNIIWQVAHHDSDALWNAAVNPQRLVVPAGAGGIWHVGACGQFAINATGARHAGLYVNGTMYASSNAIGNAGWYVGFNVSMDIYAAAGSYFELGLYQNSGGILNADVVYPFAMWARQVAR